MVHRPITPASSSRCRATGQHAHRRANGPRSSALSRAGLPRPSAIGVIPSARSSGVYSPFTSPLISVRTPNSIIRRQNATTVELFPRPGSPKIIMLGLVASDPPW